jgi:hypothetical protein
MSCFASTVTDTESRMYHTSAAMRWFPSWTGQGTEPASRWRVDGDEGVSAVDGAEALAARLHQRRGGKGLAAVRAEDGGDDPSPLSVIVAPLAFLAVFLPRALVDARRCPRCLQLPCSAHYTAIAQNRPPTEQPPKMVQNGHVGIAGGGTQFPQVNAQLPAKSTLQQISQQFKTRIVDLLTPWYICVRPSSWSKISIDIAASQVGSSPFFTSLVTSTTA